MNKKVVAAATLGILLALPGCANKPDPNIVDEKVELSVPGSDKPCYFLEVEVQSRVDGEETGETSYCAEKNEWDKNQVNREWVNADGTKK